jgi:Undecaprenyl-phosphate galactose phosphotransferase WbaP
MPAVTEPVAPVAPSELPPIEAGSSTVARTARVAVLGAADLAGLVLACFVAYLAWALPVKGQSLWLYASLAPLLGLFTLGYAIAGLYPGLGVGPVETLRRLSSVTVVGFIVLAAGSFVLKLPPTYSRVTFALALVLSVLLVPLSRAIMQHVAARWPWWGEPVVVVGTGERAARVIEGLAQRPHLGYRVAHVVALDARSAATTIGRLRVNPDPTMLPRIAASGITTALAEADRIVDRATVNWLQQTFRHVVLLRYNDGLAVEGVEVRNLGDLVGLEYTNNLLVPTNRALKRAIDVALSGVGIVVAAPVILVAIAAVKLLDRGPAFYSQPRTGLGGGRIRVPKIRTMKRDADMQLAEYLASNPDLRIEWDRNYKLRKDPRLVPVVGRFLRRFSIDELPQLWSVLAGDMSLVGPRPFPDYHLEQFSPAFCELRQRVRPGITGLWQITVRSDGTPEEQESHDSHYIRNWSLWLDLYILARTIVAVISGRGAY